MKESVFLLIGGLGFFFFGMQIMAEGLKKIAGERLKLILHLVTKLPILGVLTGIAVTGLVQSSSAVTVMVVGFVNAGLLALKQAISVIMGANIGTTVTAWLVASMSVFKITQYALPLIGIGFVVKTLAKTKNAKFWGQVILGFGILFIGLAFMKDAFEPFKESQYFKSLFISFSQNPLLGVLAGMIMTIILQSSSATIAVLQVMAFNGLISFPAAIPIILGDNIGTTITAQLASMGTNVNARRAAMSHTIFNLIGVVYFLPFVYNGWFLKSVELIIPGDISLKSIMFYIAVSHSLFNIINTLVFLPFTGLLEKICVVLVPKRKDAIELEPRYLERHLLLTPSIALDQARRETVRMLAMASKSVSTAVKGFLKGDAASIRQVSEIEEAVDNFQTVITQYLVEISQQPLSQAESEQLPVLIHSVNDIERIGDHAANIVELTERKIEKKLPFTEEAIKELTLMWNEIEGMMTDTERALDKNDIELAKNVLTREDRVNKLQVDLKRSHVERLNERKCDIRSGVVFIDIVDNFEKIGDHLTNISEGIIEGLRWKERARKGKP